MVFLGDFYDGYLSDLLCYLWFLVDCVAAFVLKFLLCKLFFVWIWICWVIYEVMAASCTVMMSIFWVVCRVHR